MAKRAGVSRGALLHHFPTREKLFAAAFGKILSDEIDMLSRFSATINGDGSSLEAIIHYIWERYKGPLFYITVDYLALARVDSATRQFVAAEATLFNEKLDELWDRSFSLSNVSPQTRRSCMNQTMCLIRGMALQRIWRDEDDYFEQMLRDWIQRLDEHLKV